jgi:uncharacterized protein (TIGR03067 family)
MTARVLTSLIVIAAVSGFTHADDETQKLLRALAPDRLRWKELDPKIDQLEEFVDFYYEKQPVSQTMGMLKLLLSEGVLDHPKLKGPPDGAGQARHFAQAFGQIARGRPEMVRQFEDCFQNARNHNGRDFLLRALAICGDGGTLRRLNAWLANPALAEHKKAFEQTKALLSGGKREPPRDRAAVLPEDIDLLWADFFVTGAYEPVARILDALDRPTDLRDLILQQFRKTGQQGEEYQSLVEDLKHLGLLKPGTKSNLVDGDLLHDARKRLRPTAFESVHLYRSTLHVSEDKIKRGILLTLAASHSLQENLAVHSRLRTLLKEHCHERPETSQEFVRKWLGLDQVQVIRGDARQELQGTWQAVGWAEDGDLRDAKTVAEVLKYVRWTFDDQELRTTKASTINNSFVLGQGGTVVSTFKVDAKDGQKILTTTTVSPETGLINRGLYSLEGDILRVCMSKNEQLPRDFSANPGSGCIVITLKKQPVDPTQRPTPARWQFPLGPNS